MPSHKVAVGRHRGPAIRNLVKKIQKSNGNRRINMMSSNRVPLTERNLDFRAAHSEERAASVGRRARRGGCPSVDPRAPAEADVFQRRSVGSEKSSDQHDSARSRSRSAGRMNFEKAPLGELLRMVDEATLSHYVQIRLLEQELERRAQVQEEKLRGILRASTRVREQALRHAQQMAQQPTQGVPLKHKRASPWNGKASGPAAGGAAAKALAKQQCEKKAAQKKDLEEALKGRGERIVVEVDLPMIFSDSEDDQMLGPGSVPEQTPLPVDGAELGRQVGQRARGVEEADRSMDIKPLVIDPVVGRGQMGANCWSMREEGDVPTSSRTVARDCSTVTSLTRGRVKECSVPVANFDGPLLGGGADVEVKVEEVEGDEANDGNNQNAWSIGKN